MNKIIKVAFYLDNRRTSTLDCTDVNCGNPGMGGTQYMFWYIASKLSLDYEDIDVYLFTHFSDKMPRFLKCREVKSLNGALDLCSKESVDVFVVWTRDIDKIFIKKLKKTSVKVISWSHNYERYPFIGLLTKTKNIKRNICVGREQLDRLVDHKLYLKSDFIYNTIQFDLYKNDDGEAFENSVCYLGSIVPEKGFDVLARIWPKIEAKVPNAQLYVVGSANLYGNKIVLGSYGIAEKRYEAKFIKFLLDGNGKIKQNVHFVGQLGGVDKIELLKKMTVGIPKSVFSHETFNICAIEFEACGVPVVAPNCYSLKEVVSNRKTGLLFSKPSLFAKCVVELLTNNKKRYSMSKGCHTFVCEKFSERRILDKWHQTICDVDKNVGPKHAYRFDNVSFVKRCRIINSKFRKVFPFIPSLVWLGDIPLMIKSLFKKVLLRK